YNLWNNVQYGEECTADGAYEQSRYRTPVTAYYGQHCQRIETSERMTRKRRNDNSGGSEKSRSLGSRRSTSPSTSRSHSSHFHPAHFSTSYGVALQNHLEKKHSVSTLKRSHTKEKTEESRNSSSRRSLQKRMGKELNKGIGRKLSTSNTKEERFKRNHSGQLQDAFGEYLRGDRDSKEEPKVEKEKPNFEPSGKLAEDTNTYRGVVIKYNEPSDAHIPKLRWRLYPFKGDEALPVLYIHRQSAYLIGRDRKIADLPVDHPSCSKQHAVFQYRLTPKDLPDGTTVKRIRPYIIDLGSANGTYLNNERIESQRFVELREKDVLKFGFSTREFVLLNEKSHDEEDVETVKKEELSPS
uniref:FHA domain-containing protein n=1 Tax=Wuchereria bancrofti TaxID=6293 RepID=A0A1I8EKY9_WUCBA